MCGENTDAEIINKDLTFYRLRSDESCEVTCDHCHGAVNGSNMVTRGRNSYHDACHKCYVCSETDLRDCEVFKGVIFCASCSRRIFNGCNTARMAKAPARPKRSCTRPRKSSRHRQRSKVTDRHKPRLQRESGVIELARLALSTTDSDDMGKPSYVRKPSYVGLAREPDTEVEKPTTVKETTEPFSRNNSSNIKKESIEMGMTTTVTQELIQQMNCPVIEWSVVQKIRKPPPPLPEPPSDYSQRDVRRNKRLCSDPRMAELGVSTEIANMALRKRSEVPVKDKSRSHPEEMPVLSPAFTDETFDGHDQDWTERSFSEVDLEEEAEYSSPAADFGDFLAMPFRYFKTRILDKSSLISIVLSDCQCNNTLLRKLKRMFHDEDIAHHRRGIKRLHSTIHRRRQPYRLGWLHIENEHRRHACRHVKYSCSYRCLRHYVMRKAGPTKSQLNFFWARIWHILLPEFVKKFLALDYRYSPMLKCEGCSHSRAASTHVLIKRNSMDLGSSDSFV